jgi:hypothetical protein
VKRLGEDARRLLDAAGVRGAAEIGPVTGVWRECVGDAIAKAAWPRRVARDGTLHVATASSTWAFELDRLSGEIGERLRAALGADAPKALRFAPGPVPEAGEEDDGDAPGPLEIPPEARSAGARIAAGIEDSALRELVARAAAASLSRARSDRSFC